MCLYLLMDQTYPLLSLPLRWWMICFILPFLFEKNAFMKQIYHPFEIRTYMYMYMHMCTCAVYICQDGILTAV